MLLWPFNKYPGTDYETFNWEWVLHTVKTYTQKVDDFIEDITNTWNAFRDDITDTWDTFKNYVNHEIAEMHRKFAIYVNVTEEALNTGAIADGAVTAPKLHPVLRNEVSPLSMFNGATSREQLITALTAPYKGTINGGAFTIDTPIDIGNINGRQTYIANSIITLNSDMFTSSESQLRLPSFVNCHFIGNGHALAAHEYVVCGAFENCVFDDCAVVNDGTATVQSPYFNGCEVSNDTVSLIKAATAYDIHIDAMRCEQQNATLIDASTGTTGQTQPRNLWITNSIFEGFAAPVIKGTGGSIFMDNCYSEANSQGLIVLDRSNENYNLLSLVVQNCRINSHDSAIRLTNFPDQYRIKISIHDNYYYTDQESTPMVTGIPIDNPYVIYNNNPASPTDVFSDHEHFPYSPETYVNVNPAIATISQRAGGFWQYGRIVMVDVTLRPSEQLTSITLPSVFTGLPKPAVNNTRIDCRAWAGDAVINNNFGYVNTNGEMSITGTYDANTNYRFRGFYFSDNKITT